MAVSFSAALLSSPMSMVETTTAVWPSNQPAKASYEGLDVLLGEGQAHRLLRAGGARVVPGVPPARTSRSQNQGDDQESCKRPEVGEGPHRDSQRGPVSVCSVWWFWSGLHGFLPV